MTFTPLDRRRLDEIHGGPGIGITLALCALILVAGTLAGYYLVITSPMSLDRLFNSFSFHRKPSVTVQSQRITNWQAYTDRDRGYTFEYPAAWKAEESTGFLNSLHIYPPDRQLEIVISEGKMPYDFGREEIVKTKTNYIIDGTTYLTDLYHVGSSQILVDIPLAHPIKEFHLLVHTMPEHTQAVNVNEVFQMHATTIARILSSFHFTDSEARWKKYVNESFRYQLYYPPDWQFQQVFGDTPSEWGPDSIVSFSSEKMPGNTIQIAYTKSPDPALLDAASKQSFNGLEIYLPIKTEVSAENENTYVVALKPEEFLVITLHSTASNTEFMQTLELMAHTVKQI